MPMIDRDFIRRMRAKYEISRDSSSAVLPEAEVSSCEDFLDRFLADTSISLAVFHSRRLGCGFVLARGPAALERLADRQKLPVLYFEDCEKLAGQALGAIRASLELRAEFGPSVELSAVRTRVG
jgi:hypothetical protein